MSPKPVARSLWRSPAADELMACSLKPTAKSDPCIKRYLRALFFHNTTWGRPGFDSGYVVRASMQSGDERLLKTIITP
jgi:hypothetical protein